MRCQKCQYVGFEPSPRCKNCGYDFSLDADTALESAPDIALDDAVVASAATLTLVAEPEMAAPVADFDLQIFDDMPSPRVQTGARPFDLDELLANGPMSGALGEAPLRAREPEPVIAPVSAVAKRRQSSAYAKSSASAVATPPPAEIEAIFKPEAATPPVAPAPSVAAAPPVASAPPVAPVTTELPLFMQGMSEKAPIVQAPVPLSVEAATVAADAMDPVLDHGADAPAVSHMSEAPEVDDKPLVSVPASPRAPLAVRRATPDPARLRAKYARTAQKKMDTASTGDLLNAVEHIDTGLEPRVVPPAQRLSAEPTPTSLPAEWRQGVSPAKRLMAAALDSALLISLNGAVIWFTLNVCGLAPAQVNLLPVAPLLLFFLLLDAGYLVLFTAACGQTLGKMAAGIRVVGTSTGAVINDRITISQAIMRSFASIASMLPLGAGFVFGLVGDRRAVHDRIAHTRVVAA